jgi:hypothetical protein
MKGGKQIMKKRWLGMGLAVALVAVVAVPGTWALDKGPEMIDINAQAQHPDIITHKDKKHVANFPHHKHQDEFLKGNAEYSNFKYTDDYTCAGCHHTNKAGEQPGGCLKCKDLNKMLDKATKGKGVKKFEAIYHINCRDGCHGAMEAAGKKTGPSKKGGGKCKGCHNRK